MSMTSGKKHLCKYYRCGCMHDIRHHYCNPKTCLIYKKEKYK